MINNLSDFFGVTFKCGYYLLGRVVKDNSCFIITTFVYSIIEFNSTHFNQILWHCSDHRLAAWKPMSVAN